MNEALQIKFFELVVSVGFDTAVAILKATTNKATVDDAIAALDATIKLRASDFEKARQE
jgi:hypothetical protein